MSRLPLPNSLLRPAPTRLAKSEPSHDESRVANGVGRRSLRQIATAVSGGGGIRTHGDPEATTVFKTVPFVRSGTPPKARPMQQRTGLRRILNAPAPGVSRRPGQSPLIHLNEASHDGSNQLPPSMCAQQQIGPTLVLATRTYNRLSIGPKRGVIHSRGGNFVESLAKGLTRQIDPRIMLGRSQPKRPATKGIIESIT